MHRSYAVQFAKQPAKRIKQPDNPPDLRIIGNMQTAICFPESEIFLQIVLESGFVIDISLAVAKNTTVFQEVRITVQRLFDQRRINPILFKGGIRFQNIKRNKIPIFFNQKRKPDNAPVSLEKAPKTSVPLPHVSVCAKKDSLFTVGRYFEG